MKTQTLILAYLICNRLGSQVPELETFDEHFNGLYKNDHVLRGFYDPTATPNTKDILTRLFRDLSNSPVVAKNNIKLGLVNVDKVGNIKKHYDILNHSHFIYFIKNQIQKINDFNEMVLDAIGNENQYKMLFKRVEQFVEDKFNRVMRELTSLDQFEEVLSENKIICAYFGPENEDFLSFKDLALSHIDFNFFYTFDEEFANEIFSLKANTKKPQSSVISVIRSAELIDEFDDSALIFTTDFQVAKRRETFFENERYPKMMKENDADVLAQRIILNHVKAVIYVHGDTDQESVEEFEEAVKNLPKKFVFSHVSNNSNKIGSYLQLFMMSKGPMVGGNVYILSFSSLRTIDSVPMNKPVTKQNIVNFVIDFYNSNQDLFENAPITVNFPQGIPANQKTDLGYSEEL